jgi:hypothetical protein
LVSVNGPLNVLPPESKLSPPPLLISVTFPLNVVLLNAVIFVAFTIPSFKNPPVALKPVESIRVKPFRLIVPALRFSVAMERFMSSTHEFGTAPELMFTISPAMGNPVEGVQFAFKFHSEETDPFHV